MTRQIALAIFLAAMLTMIAGGLLTYATARRTLLDELDRDLIARALHAIPGEREFDSPEPGDRFVADDRLGRTIARSQPATAPAGVTVVSRSFTAGNDGERMRTLSLEVPGARGNVRIVYSGSAAAFDHLQRRLAVTIAGTVLGGGVITIVTAMLISRRVTRPLQLTADAIGRVDDSHLDQRIETAHVPIELRPTIDRLNDLLARLEPAFASQRQFLGDAAHELRTPVAAMRAGLEIALSRPRSAEHLEQVVRRCLRDALQMGEIVEAMLECVRTGAERPLTPVRFDATAIIADSVEQIRPLAAAKLQTLRADLMPSMEMTSEEMPLRTILRNLLSNAVSHTPAGGEITIDARSIGGSIKIDVRDTGPGIAPQQLNRVFEPFYRADASRSDLNHLGLGLFITKRHITRLCGAIDVNSIVGSGTLFTVTLPDLDPTAGRGSITCNDGAGTKANSALMQASVNS